MAEEEHEQTDDNLPVLSPVRDAHQFDEAALDKYLNRHLEGYRGNLTLQQFSGGSSNPTFLLESGSNRWVLRKRPPGNLLPSAHQVDREYRVMDALHGTGVPVPKMHLFCDDPDVIGREFYVMEMIDGRVTRSELPNFTPAERTAFYDDFARVLAALHTVDHEAVGLAKHGRPGNYFARQIDRWSKQYVAAKTDDIPEMDRLMEWMPAHVPDWEDVSVIHGDYRVGNVLVHPTEPKIVAVLDWEISTLGHALGDLSYHCAYAYHAEFDPFIDELDERGIPSEEDYVAAYCRHAGRPPVENWNFCVAYNLFRLSSIVQGVYARGLQGIASSEFELEEQRGQVRERAEKAWALVEAM